jgi:hypothetical protein
MCQSDVVRIHDHSDDRDLTAKDILNLGACILLRVLDQVQGFPSNATLFQFHLQAEDGRTTETCSR